ncbi:receptor-type tyrosine-protein phosphatase beta-like [Hippocampus comes]|uniref:receptor-type tyrosine-protein phosphatase beta-like n=1 Tax=Hippocampus comes TaxID=109280 RepID=UPI00094E60F3|nr:PREDICTED: receptor-type tyrosine-protein phosphatase beta-like [Hippocampus comes]
MSTSCQLNGLQCGATYNLTVVAEGSTCNSTGGSQATLMTAPCSPYFENSTQICGTNSSIVSWMPVDDATGYIINARATSGHLVSCNSAIPTCALTDLECGATYTATIVAQGSQCDSPPGPPANITTAPCPPAVISKQYMCGSNTAVLSWSDTFGRLGFQAEIAGYGYQETCRTTNTSCVVHNLPCGLDLNVTVQAEGEHCNSTPSVCHSLQTAPCAPVNISATLVCFNHSALVSWVGSSSAVEYTVTSTGQNGHTHQCHSNTTSCQLSHIHCEETYDITVTPHSESCAGTPSQVYSFRAGLCSPSNVTISPPCEDNNTVSWSSVTGAEMYIATATADDGHTHTCSSNASTSCQFTDLHCGQNYSVAVVTVDRGCLSEPSSAVEVTTALCPPTNLAGEVACDTNAVTISWDPSPVPGVSYILKYQKLSGTLPPSSWTTSNTSHTLADLQCGQRYVFYIAFLDGACHSSYSPSMELSTAPCQPTNFTAHVDCGLNKGNFSWAESNGAAFYTVEVTGEHGHVASCASNDTSCAVRLHCGRPYSASLVASTESCNSTEHADIYFDSAPCLPEDVVAVMDCYTNVMNVTWSETPGTDNYTAWAISLEGHRASCNSTINNCSIRDLHCGHVYEVAVTSSSVQCEIIAGSDYKVQAAPCKPENVTGDLNCSSNIMTVTWHQVSSLAQNFTIEATSVSGVNSTCETNENNCSFLDLSCGQLYTFTITGHTNVCMSEMSYPTEMLTAPCPPGEVSAAINCTTRTALVSWDTTAAATAYSVHATSTNGHNSSCSEMGASCELDSLVCGQIYSVVVESMHTGCAGPAAAPVLLTTDPCVPMNVSVSYRVNDTRVLWSAADGASSYSVWAGNDQGWIATCNSTETSCHLSGLRCGQIYNVTVTAHNHGCDSFTSDAHRFMTEPCPPTNVLADMECEQLAVTISWDQSALAQGYVAYVYDHAGHYVLMCEAEGTTASCAVSGLMCGTQYDMWVVALGEEYNSSDSTTVMFTSEPCQPASIEAIMDCETKSAMVSWLPGLGAASYVADLTASSGHTTTCTTNETHCLLGSLPCGEQYNVSVASVGDTCDSTERMSGYLTTESCVPVNLSIHFNMSEARVTWGAARGAGSYCVQAVSDQGLTATCNSTGTQCSVTGLQCSQIYNITVAAKNDVCNNTARSETYRLMTEPCPPTNVQANVECEQLTVAVSWEQSELAVGYVVYVYDHYGYYTLMCEAGDRDTGCVVSGLMCGTQYDVWAIARGGEYNSSESTTVSFTSAPCLPTNINVEVDCNSDGVAVASWSPPYGTANISLTASGSLEFPCQAEHNNALSICNLTGLDCGETYNLSLTASNDYCSVTSHMHSNFTTRPCRPQYVGVALPCGSETAVLSWEESPEVELYMGSAILSSGGEEHWCNATGSSCMFPDLSCGEMYNFTVKALSHGCCSQASDSVYIQTEPCQPVIVMARSPCQTEELQVSWNPARGVVFYLITTTGSLGYVRNYNTTQTSLTAALPCGQNYSVIVQGQGSECNSDPSSPAFVKTSPCIPRDVMTHEQCGANAAAVYWRASDGAITYAAEAIGLDGHSHWCYSNHSNCTWDDLHCGDEYTVLVMAEDEDCASLPSNSSVIYMEPCLPQNVLASVDCEVNAISLSWDASNGTKMYVVSLDTEGQSVMHSTNDTEVHLSGLNCGENYSLTVTPHNHYCVGMTSVTTSIQTWPCPPREVYTMKDCLSGIVMVAWQPSNGTDHYMATMGSVSGVSQTCMSYSGECNISGLTCGQNFAVSVTASNQLCNVTSVAYHSVQSVPCVPADVSVAKDCDSNTAAVSWSASDGATQYLVTASCYHGNVSHQTSDLNYTLNDLMCGSRYAIQVVAMDDNCSSVPSHVLIFDTAPCPPLNVTTQLSCMSNNLTVSWDSVGYADYFLVWLSEDNVQGSGETFNTTDNECSTSHLNCGSSYAVQVTAVKGDCRTQSNQNYSILTAPCQPQGIQGSLDCVTNSAWISWDSALGADCYAVLAIGEDDSTANCTTWTNTTCEVEDLACGILYHFSVTAKNSQCDSYPSATIDLQTAPCSLAGITAVPECHNASILVIWELAEGGEGNTVYIATAEASDHTYLSCNGTGTNCTLRGAQCDLHYTVIVAASSDRCSSLRSPPYRLSMEPCPPSEVTVRASCEDHSALVSWTSSPVAATYYVVASAADGHTHTCSGSSSTNCSLSGLHCDEQYTVYVTASHENCTSMASHNVTFSTGPCQPEGLSVAFHCSNESAVLSWTPSDNAVDYYGCAQTWSGEMLYCHSTYPTCTISNLNCGTLYNFTVQASDGTCNSSFSDPVQRGAAPCPPDAVEVQPMMMYAEIQTLQFTWTDISCASTEYLLRLSGNLLGDSQARFEVSSYWTTTTSFEIPLPCGSYYVATVESRNMAGTSNQSVPLHETTAPCQPSTVLYSSNSSVAKVSWSPSVFATTYTVYKHNISLSSRLCTTSGLACFLLINIAYSDLLVTASNAAGESRGSTVASVVSHEVRKRDLSESEVPVLNVSLLTNSLVMAEWPQEDVANDTAYKLVISQQRANSESPQELIVLGQSYILTDLSPNSTYCLTVSAWSETNVGPASDSVCLETGQAS